YDQQCEILNKANLEIIAYQLGLESLEARIVVHQKNEAVFKEDIAFLKYDVKVIDNSVTELKNQLEKSLKEKYDLKLKLEKFEASFKNLTNLINSQISPKDKTGLGYDSQLNERDLNNKSDVFESTSDSCVNESEEDNNQANGRYKAVEGYHAVPPSYTGNFMPPRLDMSFVGLDDSDFKSVISETVISVHETKTSVSKTSKEKKSVLNNKGKATGQREVKPVWNNAQRVNHQNFSNNLTHPHTRRNFVPTAVITNSGKVPVNTAKQSSPRAATSISTARYIITATTRPTVNGAKPSLNVFHKSHSPVRRTFNQITAPKINDLKETINTDKVNNVTTAGSRDFDSGCSKNMTGNKSFYTDYQEINGGFVAFGGSPIGGKISRKGKIRIGKLDFKDVYFVKELKFNLFSVSQMCDKKNSVLFTETKCLVLSPEFKLLDENQVLLKVPKQNNMYSFD
nr:ribonuclease H-like domain-containing protein [Tanacetum cinerariifolium]